MANVLTGVPGLYKTGFTLGVVGIFYSAYSLIKVCDSSGNVPP
jgi:hypothetical protein